MLCHLRIHFQPININFLIKSININIKTPNMKLENKTETQVKIRVEINLATVILMIKTY